MLRRVAVALLLTCAGGGASQAQDMAACRAAEGEAAIAACTGALATQLAPAEAAEAYRRRGLARLGQRDAAGAAGAVADFSEALKRRPASVVDMVDRGRALIRLKAWRRAIADFDAALRREPNNQDAYFWRGDAYLALGQPDRALADYRKVSRAPRYAGLDRRLGDAHLAKKDFVEAYRHYGDAIKQDPADAEAKAALARLQIPYDEHQCGNTESPPERDSCTRLIESGRYAGKRLAYWYLRRGQDWSASEHVQRSLADLTEAIRLDPADARAFAARGDLVKQYGDKALALADYDAAIARNPRVAEYWAARAELLAEAGRHDRAIADYAEAIRRDPRQARYRAARADSLMALGRHRDVVAEATAALALLPRKRVEPQEAMHGRLSMLLGQAYEKLGDRARAIAAYRAARDNTLEVPEGVDEALQRLGVARPAPNESMEACRGADARGEPAQAVELCTKALEAGGLAAKDAAVAHVRRAEAYFARGEYDRAWADYAAAIRFEPRNAELFFQRAQLFASVPAFLDRAIADCGAAIRLDPRHEEAYTLRATIYEDTAKDYAKAIQDRTALMRFASDPLLQREARGELYAKLGRLREAIADFSAVLARQDRLDSRWGRALAYAALGELDRALADFDRAIALSPASAAVLRARATVLFRKGEQDRAAADYAEALAFDAGDAAARAGLRATAPTSPGIAALWRCFVDTGEAAREACTAAAESDDAGPARRGLALLGRGRHRFAAEDWAGAIADAAAALDLRGHYAPAFHLRGRARLEAGQFRDAANDFFRSGIDGAEPRAYFALAHLRARRVNFAVGQYGLALGRDRANPVVIGVGGAIQEVKEIRPGAIASYRRALAADPALRFARQGLERLDAAKDGAATPDALACESGEDAAAACDRAIADQTLPARGRAWALVRRGGLRLGDDPAAALADFDAALALAADLAPAQYGRGAALFALQRHDAAIVAFGAALALDPDSANALVARAAALRAFGRDADALADVDKALALNDDFAGAYLLRARLHETLGNLEKARADLRKALEIDPNDTDAKAALKRLEDK